MKPSYIHQIELQDFRRNIHMQHIICYLYQCSTSISPKHSLKLNKERYMAEFGFEISHTQHAL